jgi:hypothetical protein
MRLLLSPLSAAPLLPAAALSSAVDQLLKAYSSRDVEQFLKLIDPDEILILGTDLSEVADFAGEGAPAPRVGLQALGQRGIRRAQIHLVRTGDRPSSVRL